MGLASLEGRRPHDGEQGAAAPVVWPETRKARGSRSGALAAVLEHAGQLCLLSEAITRETAAASAHTMCCLPVLRSGTPEIAYYSARSAWGAATPSHSPGARLVSTLLLGCVALFVYPHRY